MHKFFFTAASIFAAGVLLPGNVLAQDTPAGTTQTTPPSTSTGTTKTSQTPAAKRPATAGKSAAPLTLKTEKEKFSYALGMKMGGNLKKQDVPVDPAILARGLKDALAGGKTLLTDDEAQAALKAVQDDLRAKQQAK